MSLQTIADITLALVAIFGMVGTALNIFVVLRNRADIAELKLWIMRHFVTREELSASIASYQRESVQLRDSWARVSKTPPEH